jgi:hypothetical protein
VNPEVVGREPLFLRWEPRRLPLSVTNHHPHTGGCWYQQPVIPEGTMIEVEFFDGSWVLSSNALPATRVMTQGWVRVGRATRASSEVLVSILRLLGFNPDKTPRA